MAVPARRTSKAKKAKRRTHYKLTIKGLNECPKAITYVQIVVTMMVRT